MAELNKQDLDNYITGHYGEDQFTDDFWPPEDEEDHEPPPDADQIILDGEFEDLPEEPDSAESLGLERHPGMS